MKRNLAILCLLVANSFGVNLQSVRAGDIFQWRDSSDVVHFTDDYSRIPLDVRNTPDRIIRHFFIESNVEALPASEAVAEKVPHESTRNKDLLAPKETTYNDAAGDSGDTDNVTVIVVNNSEQNKPCHGHGCAARFKPNFNDRRYIHPDVFNGGTRQYIQPGSGARRRR